MNEHPRLFMLVNPANSAQIFAVGVHMGDEAVTFRRDPDSGPQFATHGSAQGAHRFYSRVTELDLIWEDEEWDKLLTSTLRELESDMST